MPIFEYTCESCRQQFELLMSRSNQPSCPACGSETLRKELSVFAVGNAASATDVAPSACGTCGDPRGPGACSLD